MKLGLVKIGLVAGFIGGILCNLFFSFIFNFAPENPLTPVRHLDFGIPILTMVFAVLYLKNGRKNRILHFWEGLSINYAINFSLAIVSASLISIWLQVRPEILQEYITWSVEFLNKMGPQVENQLGKEAFQAQITEIQNTSIKDIWWDEFLKKSLLGLLIGPLVAVIMRKTKV